ncbi:hypothetical protein Pcinc_000410 [Petrolisthes cinctipes]|uniref:Uncharacterized protein n=1 Tax=Petrolisthes cinctipes TaxID=88211 RepID=A0AAE1GPP5_PETCI|nr:hypothetical protein Pcinc_000410 [Petrolisthes cinctipes]
MPHSTPPSPKTPRALRNYTATRTYTSPVDPQQGTYTQASRYMHTSHIHSSSYSSLHHITNVPYTLHFRYDVSTPPSTSLAANTSSCPHTTLRYYTLTYPTLPTLRSCTQQLHTLCTTLIYDHVPNNYLLYVPHYSRLTYPTTTFSTCLAPLRSHIVQQSPPPATVLDSFIYTPNTPCNPPGTETFSTHYPIVVICYPPQCYSIPPFFILVSHCAFLFATFSFIPCPQLDPIFVPVSLPSPFFPYSIPFVHPSVCTRSLSPHPHFHSLTHFRPLFDRFIFFVLLPTAYPALRASIAQPGGNSFSHPSFCSFQYLQVPPIHYPYTTCKDPHTPQHLLHPHLHSSSDTTLFTHNMSLPHTPLSNPPQYMFPTLPHLTMMTTPCSSTWRWFGMGKHTPSSKDTNPLFVHFLMRSSLHFPHLYTPSAKTSSMTNLRPPSSQPTA